MLTTKTLPKLILLFATVVLVSNGMIAQDLSFDKYHQPVEIESMLAAKTKANSKILKIHELAKTYTGHSFLLYEVGSEVGQSIKKNPAILVVANLEGTTPLASEAALFLIDDLLKTPEKYQTLTWYIVPSANPEAARSFFADLKFENSRNLKPYNDDLDELTDEDGPEDLNGDGFITQMRVKDPDGTYIPDSTDARILRRADVSKGEKGIYKIYPEGIDNDGDGKYNEDGLGGTDLSINFPHLFKQHNPESGIWPGSENEVFAILKFVIDHPQIAMTMTYGHSNFCLIPPQGGRKSSSNLNSIKIPARNARMLNADPEKSYTMAEVIELAKAVMPPGVTLDEGTIASMLGLGAVVNPLREDLKFYKSFSDDYKKYLKEKKMEGERLDPAKAKDGSFELWAYYHIGLPSFSMDFWGIPKFKKPKAEKDSTANSKADKPDEAVKSEDPPKSAYQAKAGKPAKKESPQMTFLAYNDSLLGGQGFVTWSSYQHPVLGLVDIGGIVPYAMLVPPAEEIKTLIETQVPWVYTLVKEIPDLEFETSRIKAQGNGIYKLEVWVINKTKLPFPTAMGKRNNHPPPAIVSLEGKDLSILEGKKSQPLTGLNGYAKRKFEWLILAPKPTEIIIKVDPKNAYGDRLTLKLGGN